MYLDSKLNLFHFFSSGWKKFKYKYSGFPYSGIHIFTGEQGAGKTLKLVDVLHKILEEYPEALVCSNIHLKDIDYFPYYGIQDFFLLRNGTDGIIFVLDEIQTLYSSLESKNMPVSTLTVWSQNRKNRRIILGTSQRYQRVAKGLREQTKFHIECKEGFWGFMKYRVIDACEYGEDGKLPIDYEIPRFSWYVPKASIMDSYDTSEVVRRV